MVREFGFPDAYVRYLRGAGSESLYSREELPWQSLPHYVRFNRSSQGSLREGDEAVDVMLVPCPVVPDGCDAGCDAGQRPLVVSAAAVTAAANTAAPAAAATTAPSEASRSDCQQEQGSAESKWPSQDTAVAVDSMPVRDESGAGGGDGIALSRDAAASFLSLLRLTATGDGVNSFAPIGLCGDGNGNCRNRPRPILVAAGSFT